jgi:hypothetical protein
MAKDNQLETDGRRWARVIGTEKEDVREFMAAAAVT